ncbi:MAG TPA: FAD-dependent oxidoreductase [Verrucomicrobiae bacterium]|nr:FAD-dependent oxidoreductase [Verrucomicrobiae bacterium]
MSGKKRIVIVGGGFGGVKCAETLRKGLAHDGAEIVLFNDQNHLVFSPLLAEVVGSSLNPIDVIVPLRQLLPYVYCRTEGVRDVDVEKRQIEFAAESGEIGRFDYDHLVFACGNVTDLNVVPGMADHAFPLKTVADAAELRSHVMEQMEKAEVASSRERRLWHLTFVIVGGGFSGAETAGEINDLVRSSACYFRNWKAEDVTVLLIHSREQILPELSPGLREFAHKKMAEAGVKIILNERVTLATPDGVGLRSGGFVKGATIVCTVGNSSAPVLSRLPLPQEKGRIVTDPDMRVRGQSNIWAIGDCALIINQFNNQVSPTTGQFAERQGRQCALNILRALKNKPTRPFRFHQLGELCAIGGHAAVADLLGMQLSGFIAWFIWRGIYLFKLPTWARRFQVGFDWAWLVFFPRDLAHIRTRPTERISHAHYRAGDIIVEKGDPSTNFYVIEKGEVEVTRATDKDPKGEVIAVLGAGSFFGEKALMSNEPRVANVRARTDVDVVVMGKNVFTRISGALAPLRDALSQTLNRRGMDVWKSQPEVLQLLRGAKLRDLLEPVPQPLLKPDNVLADITRAVVEHGNEFFYVSADGQTLDGVVTMTDLLRARSAGASAQTPVSEFMTKNPVALAADDDLSIASAAMREYRLKSLPVIDTKDARKLVGCLKIRKLMAFILERNGKPANPVPAQR